MMGFLALLGGGLLKFFGSGFASAVIAYLNKRSDNGVLTNGQNVTGDPTLEGILFGDMPDEATCTFTIKLGDTRRARAALTSGAHHADA